MRSFAQNQVRRVAREFALTDALAEAAAMAQRILSGEGARRDAAARIGTATKYRCITKANCCGWTGWCAAPARASGGCSITRRNAAEQQDELIGQLRRYRAGGAGRMPRAPAQAAFLTGRGRLVVVP